MLLECLQAGKVLLLRLRLWQESWVILLLRCGATG